LGWVKRKKQVSFNHPIKRLERGYLSDPPDAVGYRTIQRPGESYQNGKKREKEGFRSRKALGETWSRDISERLLTVRRGGRLKDAENDAKHDKEGGDQQRGAVATKGQLAGTKGDLAAAVKSE